MTDNPGYHVNHITQGQLGELSKVQEELEEALDAETQQSAVMVLVELSDMLGAVEAYLAKHHPSMSIKDLLTFSAITKRAFQSGRRVSKATVSEATSSTPSTPT